MGSYRMCVCFTRRYRVTEAEPPADVKGAFRKYAEGGPHMSADQLRHFLAEVQLEEASPEAAERLLEQVQHRRHHLSRFRKHALSFDDFYHFLFSGDLNPPISDQVHNDMKAHLSHYFIYTGHNSYLTGNQISSDSSDVPIIKALRRGVRVVELDIWPNSSGKDVHVRHGRTLTTPVELLKCLRSIREHAFEASPYPVIITLEDHLTSELQAKVAEMLTETFGDMLYCPKSDCREELLSPEDLKYRIIVSTKLPKAHPQSKIDDQGSKTPEKSLKTKASEGADHEQEENESDSETSDCSPECDESDKFTLDRSTSEPKAYKCLIAIHSGKPKGGLKEQLKVDPVKIRRLSLNEQTFGKATTLHGTDVVRFTQNNFLRVYPKNTRIDSSNYKPLNGWMHGAQMVALNMQGYGKSLWLMHGMFRANGGCGYVKKPDFLMDEHGFDPKVKLPVKKTLKVKIYMGDGWRLDFKQTHFDRYSPPDFYTRVGIAGVPADEAMKKTKTKEDDWTPVWEEEFTFPLSVPELALLRIEVNEYDMSEKDDFAGQTCLPVSELKPGIRTVPLFNRKGDKYSAARLLVRFDFV